MLPISQFALFVHEAVYSYMRDTYKVTDSVIARKLTACAVAESPCPELSVKAGLPTSGPQYECRPDDWNKGEANWVDYGKPTFMIFPIDEAAGNWRFQLMSANSNPWQMSKMYFDQSGLKGLTAENFYTLGDLGTLKVAYGVDKVYESGGRSVIISSDDPQKNMAIPIYYHVGVQDSTVTLNGSPLLCKKIR